MEHVPLVERLIPVFVNEFNSKVEKGATIEELIMFTLKEFPFKKDIRNNFHRVKGKIKLPQGITSEEFEKKVLEKPPIPKKTDFLNSEAVKLNIQRVQVTFNRVSDAAKEKIISRIFEKEENHIPPRNFYQIKNAMRHSAQNKQENKQDHSLQR